VRSISAFPPVRARHKRDGYLFRKTLSHSAKREWSEKFWIVVRKWTELGIVMPIFTSAVLGFGLHSLLRVLSKMKLPLGVYLFRLFAFQSVVGSTTSPVKIKYHSISPLGLPLDCL
jgi:hypothetical protein